MGTNKRKTKSRRAESFDQAFGKIFRREDGKRTVCIVMQKNEL
jgi:hypothetical protein